MNEPSGPETILVVDDEPSVITLTATVLAGAGYNVLQAANGAQALEICEGPRPGIDLLLTDVVMPRMSGPQLADRLLELYPDLLVIFMSGYEDYQFEKYRPFAFKRFLRKPFAPDFLLSTVRSVLDDRRKGEPGRQSASGDARKRYG